MTSASVVMARAPGRRSRNPQSLSERCALFSVKEKTLVIDQVVSKVAVLFHGGTSGSNPRFLHQGVSAHARALRCFRPRQADSPLEEARFDPSVSLGLHTIGSTPV